ncbi:MAG: PKD domain-containing protein [Bacteroidetes bacterium]|nr:PKD domain-containing protein [Bacteroidota bacterium]
MNIFKYTYLLFAILLITTKCVAQPGTTWQSTGPNLFPTDISGQINGIGRVSQLKFHPTNPLKMYAVSASGGLWISSDSANSWVKTGSDNLPATACASVCIDYTDDNILYLGTGDANYYGGDFGIWKSTDAGATWTQSTTGLGNLLPIEILMSPTNNNILVTATNNGIYKSTNAGANWVLVKTGGDFTDMQFQPGSSTTLYAVTHSQFWKSTDFGTTWVQTTAGVTIPGGGSGEGMRIAVSAANPSIVYVGMVKQNGTILKSTNSGASFTTVYTSTTQSIVGYDATDIGGGQGNYNFSMTADPSNPNNLFVVSHVVWRSTNGGVSWTQLTDWWANLHTDMHGIAYHPTFPGKLFSINDGGVWRSLDNGDNWTQRSNGLSATEIYHASQSPIKQDMISIGTQDNGELYYSSGSWKTNRGGDWGSRSSFDYLTNNMVYYYENGDRRIVTGSDASYNLPFTPTNNIVLEFRKNITTTGFSGEQNIWRTTNLNAGTPTWTQISTFNQQVKAINSSPADSTMLYVVTASNKVYRSDNALAPSPTFTMYTAPGSTALYASIAGIKSNPNIVYVSCGSKVYRSSNKGSTWTDVSSNLPVGVNIIKIYHDEFNTNEAMYVCSAKGVYYKEVGSALWTNISYNLPTVANIQDFMVYNPGTTSSLIRVAYYGRGVWELPLNVSMPPAPSFTVNENTICPGTTVTFTDLSTGSPTAWSWSFPGGTPSTSTLQNPTVTYPAVGTYNVTLSCTNGFGTNSVTESSYMVVSSSQSLPFAEGFASSATPPNWSNYDYAGNAQVWQHSTAVGGFGTSSQSVFFDNYSYDANGERDELRTPLFDFTAVTHPILTFDRAYARYSGTYNDSLVVLISTDCGQTYTSLYTKSSTALATAPDFTSAIFVPTSGQWDKDTIDLLAYSGQNNILFAFQNRGHYGQAVYLDNINLSDLLTTAIDQNSNIHISVYPNPSSGQFNFSGLEKGSHIEVFDLTGKKIYETTSNSDIQRIDISEKAKGVYFYRITKDMQLIQSGEISLQ